MSTPASDGDSAVSSAVPFIMNGDDEKGRRFFLSLVVAVEDARNDETKDLRAEMLHIHNANEKVQEI